MGPLVLWRDFWRIINHAILSTLRCYWLEFCRHGGIQNKMEAKTKTIVASFSVKWSTRVGKSDEVYHKRILMFERSWEIEWRETPILTFKAPPMKGIQIINYKSYKIMLWHVLVCIYPNLYHREVTFCFLGPKHVVFQLVGEAEAQAHQKYSTKSQLLVCILSSWKYIIWNSQAEVALEMTESY